MAKLIISALEQAVLKSIKSIGDGLSVPQNMIAERGEGIKASQVSAVINNMIGKGLVTRSKDLFSNNVELTRSGKIQTTKLINRSLAA